MNKKRNFVLDLVTFIFHRSTANHTLWWGYFGGKSLNVIQTKWEKYWLRSKSSSLFIDILDYTDVSLKTLEKCVRVARRPKRVESWRHLWIFTAVIMCTRNFHNVIKFWKLINLFYRPITCQPQSVRSLAFLLFIAFVPGLNWFL